MSYLNINSDLFLGSQELNRLVKFLDEDGFRKLFLKDSISFGVFNNSKDGNFDNFKISQGTNVGTIQNAEGFAVDVNGQIIYKAAKDNQTLTDDSQWRWVKIKHAYSPKELFTVSIDRNGNLVAPSGELTKILRGTNNASVVTFPESTLNTGEYHVTEVVDDQNAVLAGDFVAESNIVMAVRGTFTPDINPPTASKFPFQYDSCEFTLVLETVLNTPPTLIEDEEFVVARVRRSGSTITIQDKRFLNIYKSKSQYDLENVETAVNPLIGVEAVKFNNNLTPRDQNLVYLAWTFRSSNWTINTSTNTVTLLGGLGGKFKTTAGFTDGDFDGWRLYTKDGSYAVIKQSSVASLQINLVLDSLEANRFSDTTQQLVVAPNADEIELIFAADVDDNTDLLNKRVSYHINNGQVIVPLVVYKSTTCAYNVKYRYKNFKTWGQETLIPSDTTNGYLVEADFDVNGVQIASARQTYTQHATDGFIILTLATNAYSNRIANVETGDLFGFEYHAVDTTTETVIDFIVGERRAHTVITNDTDTDNSEPTFGSPYALTANLYLNLVTTEPDTIISGNKFLIQFRGEYTLGAFNIYLVQDYISVGNPGTPIYTLTQYDLDQSEVDNLAFECTYDGQGDWVVRRIEVVRDDSVTTSKIKDLAITNAKIANSTITTAKMSDVVSGTYLPTLTNTTNISASTAYTCQYLRVGSVVTVSGKVSIDPTAGGATTELEMSLPIASNFATQQQCGGTANNAGATAESVSIRASTTNDTAFFFYRSAGSAANEDFFFSFTYLIV